MFKGTTVSADYCNTDQDCYDLYPNQCPGHPLKCVNHHCVCPILHSKYVIWIYVTCTESTERLAQESRIVNGEI